MKNKLSYALALTFLSFVNSHIFIARAQASDNGVSLNGVDQYVSVPTAAGSAMKSTMTIEAWVYEREYASSARLMDFGNQAGNSEIAFSLSSGTSGKPRVQFFIGAGLLVGDLISPSVVPLNTWTHLAFAYDGANGSIYINGSLAANGPMIFPTAPATRTNNFIGRSNWGDPYANAIIDEFRVWTVARTPEQIRGSFYKRLLGTEAGLLLYYKFDSASGSVAYNYAEAGGAAYDGALVNGPAWVSRPTYTVTTTADGGPGSLRDAINTLPAGGSIHFAADLSGQAITLTQGQLVVNNNVIIDASALAGGLTLNGLPGLPGSRILVIAPNTTVALDSLGFQGGHAADNTANGPGDSGGAIHNSGTLTLTRCTLAYNLSGRGSVPTELYSPGSRGGHGGAIYNSGTLTLTGCTLFGNWAGVGGASDVFTRGGDGGDGGAIYSSGTLALTGCTLYGNRAAPGGHGGQGFSVFFADPIAGGDGGNGGNGGAIFSSGTLTLTRCTINTNFTYCGGPGGRSHGGGAGGNGGNSGSGGAIYNTGPLSLTSCTLSGNLAGNDNGGNVAQGGPGRGAKLEPEGNDAGKGADGGKGGNGGNGGAIFSSGTLTLTHCTLSANSTGSGYTGGPAAAGGYGDNNEDYLVFTPETAAGGPGGVGGSGGSGGNGGAICVSGPIALTGCTLFGNRAGGGGNGGSGGEGGQGGEGYTFVALNVLNKVPPGNGGNGGNGGVGGNGGYGGAISISGDSTITSCTLGGNGGAAGGVGGVRGAAGIALEPTKSNGLPGADGLNGDVGLGGGIDTVGNCILWNTLVALNFTADGTAPDILGAVTSQGHNLIGKRNGSSWTANGVSGDLRGTTAAPIDPLLSTLGNYGGPTQTMPLLPGSPAIDGGDDSIVNIQNADQRGFPRLAGLHVDIGAVEGIYNADGPGKLPSPARLANGSIQFGFNNDQNMTFSVYASDDAGAPFSLWSYVGPAVASPPGSGHFQFTDIPAINSKQRFYRVSSP